MRVAIVSTGLGRVRRGFEAFTDSLFHALRRRAPELDVTLFQGGGPAGERRVTVPNLHRSGIPARWLGPDAANLLEKRSFAIALYPRLRAGRYNVVHYNELTMGSALFHLRRRLGGRFALLYCNGAPSPPVHYHHRCDFAQLLTGTDHEQARECGVAESRLFALPYGVDADTFGPQSRRSRAAIRRELGIPPEARVILSVAAIKRDHKRIDHLIGEAAALDGDAVLVVAGQRTEETPALERLAERCMPGRWRFVCWPHARVAELYGAADVFVLCSLTEAFGLVTVEAMLSEVPVFVHDGPVFRWLLDGTAVRTVDMARPGQLAQSLSEALERRASDDFSLQQVREVARQRFSWDALIPKYVEMYRDASTRLAHSAT